MAGYIGNRNGGLAATAERKTVITATSGQTVFTSTGGYTIGNIHVYQNGVRLVDGTDYTATNGSTVVLTTGAATDDQIVIIAPASYHNTDSYTKAESDGVRTFNRTSTDGSIVTLQKDGTTVGSIGVIGGHPHISSASGYLGIGGATGAPFMYSYSNALYPTADNTRDLGTSGNRFKDLYLSGGVVFGSTGGSVTSKTLDDYEEGTWTPTVTSSGTNPTLTYQNRNGTYTKVGRMVTVVCDLRLNVTSVGSGSIYISSLPFSTATTYAGIAWGIDNAFYNGYAVGGGYLSGSTVFTGQTLRVLNGGYITFTATYETS